MDVDVAVEGFQFLFVTIITNQNIWEYAKERSLEVDAANECHSHSTECLEWPLESQSQVLNSWILNHNVDTASCSRLASHAIAAGSFGLVTDVFTFIILSWSP